MHITIRQETDITVIQVAGKMVVGEAGTNVWERVREALDAGHRKIVLSLAEVTRLDSSGVGELVAAHTSAGRKGGRLKLAGLSPKLAEILQITQLLGLIESYEYEADAVTSFVSDRGPNPVLRQESVRLMAIDVLDCSSPNSAGCSRSARPS